MSHHSTPLVHVYLFDPATSMITYEPMRLPGATPSPSPRLRYDPGTRIPPTLGKDTRGLIEDVVVWPGHAVYFIAKPSSRDRRTKKERAAKIFGAKIQVRKMERATMELERAQTDHDTTSDDESDSSDSGSDCGDNSFTAEDSCSCDKQDCDSDEDDGNEAAENGEYEDEEEEGILGSVAISTPPSLLSAATSSSHMSDTPFSTPKSDSTPTPTSVTSPKREVSHSPLPLRNPSTSSAANEESSSDAIEVKGHSMLQKNPLSFPPPLFRDSSVFTSTSSGSDDEVKTPDPLPTLAVTYFDTANGQTAAPVGKDEQQSNKRKAGDHQDFVAPDCQLRPAKRVKLAHSSDTATQTAPVTAPARSSGSFARRRSPPSLFIQPKRLSTIVVNPVAQQPAFSLKRRREDDEEEDGGVSEAGSGPGSPQHSDSGPATKKRKTAGLEERRPTTAAQSLAQKRWDERLKNQPSGGRIRIVSTNMELLGTKRKAQRRRA